MFDYIKKGLIAMSLMLVAVNVNAQTSVGELELSNANKLKQLALLLNTDISGSVNGLVASINVKQTFQNNVDDWVNGRYVFPLPEGAAVDSFRMRIGDRIIDGLIKEKEQAEREFKAAKRSGKKAGLLTQHRPNLFSISVANIGPHEEVVTELTFINKVHFEDNTFSLSLPTTITPRYIPNAQINTKTNQEIEQALDQTIEQALKETPHVEINSASGWAANTSRVIDANDITPPQTNAVGRQTSNNFSLSLSVNAGLRLQSMVSESHTITSNYLSESNVEVTLANGTEKMDSDLVLEWQASVGETPQAAFFQQKFKGAYYSMLMVTPPQVDTSLSLPRDVTFVIDTSGSMSGVSMRQAKQALHTGLDYLSPNDKFNIIEFNSSYSSLFTKSQVVTSATLSTAHKMVDGLEADGGTEMLAPLKHVFNQHTDKTYLSQVIFITDGSIGNESELFSMIKNNLNESRLFTVGIGSAPNSFFMAKVAQFGRGTSTSINDLSKVTEKMALLFEKITSPVMRDIKVTWPQAAQVEAYPSQLSDLYSGQPLMLVVKSDSPITKAQISGQLVNTPWNQTLNLETQNQQQTDNLDTVWARQKVASLMDQFRTGQKTKEQTKTNVVQLGIEHNIVTKFTAFLAVEATPSKPLNKQAKNHAVPNLMPKGNTMPAPQTATPSTLLMLLGVLLMLLSWVVGGMNRARQLTTVMSYRTTNDIEELA